MAGVRGAHAVLNRDTALFAFLPTVNYTYLIVEGSWAAFALPAVPTAVCSAAVYLSVRGSPTFDGWGWLLTAIPTWLWLVGYGYSLWRLWGLVGGRSEIPSILLLVSTVFLSLLIFELLFRRASSDYDGVV